jgi:hypothetical protein
VFSRAPDVQHGFVLESVQRISVMPMLERQPFGIVQSSACKRMHQCAAASVMASYSASESVRSVIDSSWFAAF